MKEYSRGLSTQKFPKNRPKISKKKFEILHLQRPQKF
eukprot:UN00810